MHIGVIASFNRVKALIGPGLQPDYAVTLVKEVLFLSSLVEVNDATNEVRLKDGKWRDFILPEVYGGEATELGARGQAVARIAYDSVREGEGDDTEDDDIEFVIGKDGSPTKRNWSLQGDGGANKGGL